MTLRAFIAGSASRMQPLASWNAHGPQMNSTVIAQDGRELYHWLLPVVHLGLGQGQWAA